MREIVTGPITMSSLDIVDLINAERDKGSALLRHDNFMTKIENHPGITPPKFLGDVIVPGPNGAKRKSKCYHLPKREAELMVMSESLIVQTRVYDKMISLQDAINKRLLDDAKLQLQKANDRLEQLTCETIEPIVIGANVTHIASLLGISPSELNIELRDLNLQERHIDRLWHPTKKGLPYLVSKNEFTDIYGRKIHNLLWNPETLPDYILGETARKTLAKQEQDKAFAKYRLPNKPEDTAPKLED